MTNGRGDVVKIERSIELQMKTEILKGRWVPLRVVNDVHKLPRCPRPTLFLFFSSFTHGYCITDLYGDDAEEPEAKRENRALCVSSISILLLSFQKIKK